MAIILDTNCFSHVFNGKDQKHQEFVPVLDWVVDGEGFFVYGGTKYENELKECRFYHKIFNLLKAMNKVIHFKDKKDRIDTITQNLKDKYGNKDFDDPHLPAIVQVTKCKLICSQDTRSMGYVRDSKMYPKGFEIPHYYTGSKDKDLLIERNIDEDLKKYKKKLKKETKSPIYKAVETFEEDKHKRAQ